MSTTTDDYGHHTSIIFFCIFVCFYTLWFFFYVYVCVIVPFGYWFVSH